MTAVTDSDLRELKDLILGMDKKLDIYIARTDERFNTIDEKFKSIDQRFDQVDRRIDDLNSRLNTLTFGIFSIVGVFATGILGIVGKVVFFPNP